MQSVSQRPNYMICNVKFSNSSLASTKLKLPKAYHLACKHCLVVYKKKALHRARTAYFLL